MKEKTKAVALKYPADADAPFISASGKGVMAEKILQIAKENKIPVVENSNLTNVLSLQDVGEIIPEDTYGVIAKIFAFIMELERN